MAGRKLAKSRSAEEKASDDARAYWLDAVLALPAVRKKRGRILRLIRALDQRLYPGFVLEKLYYCGLYPKFAPHVDLLFGLAHGNIGLAYKPESVLYWLRICAGRIRARDIPLVFELGRIAQQRRIKPEWIFYELWGFTNIPYLSRGDYRVVIGIMAEAMRSGIDPYDVFHWLRVGMELEQYAGGKGSSLLKQVRRRFASGESPLKYLAEMRRVRLRKHPSWNARVARAIESYHIL